MQQAGKTHRRGVSIVWTVILIIVLIGLVGLAIDIGYVLLVSHQLQNGADASALAGAGFLKTGNTVDVRQAAVDLAAANEAARLPINLQLNASNDPAGDIVLGRFDRENDVFTPTLIAPNSVKVVARRASGFWGGEVPLVFARLAGVQSIEMRREAIAMNQGGTGGGIVALCPDCECALDVNGTPDIHVNGGDVHVSSTDECAFCGVGNALIDAPEMLIAGEACQTPNVEFTGNLEEHAYAVQDPLAFVPDPVVDTTVDLGTISGSGTYPPGYYSGGVDIAGGNVVLEPGIYYLDGDGLNITGNAEFTANNVMFYVMGTGFVDITGTGVITVTPPDPEVVFYPGADVYEGISIFQARDNPNPSRIIGTSLLDLEGTIYVSRARLTISGTGDGFGNQLVAWELSIGGTGEMTIEYEGSFPAPGDVVFLVR